MSGAQDSDGADKWKVTAKNSITSITLQGDERTLQMRDRTIPSSDDEKRTKPNKIEVLFGTGNPTGKTFNLKLDGITDPTRLAYKGGISLKTGANGDSNKFEATFGGKGMEGLVGIWSDWNRDPEGPNGYLTANLTFTGNASLTGNINLDAIKIITHTIQMTSLQKILQL